MGENNDLQVVVKRILSDIRIGLGDEFDQNFERESFFSEKWARRKSPLRPGGHILVDTGALRRSVSSKSDDHSITFYSDLPYAAIHNEGGEIKITAKMKRYFWARYYEAQGGFGRKKNGELRQNKKNRQLGTEAEFWKAMALMKVGKTIRIPKRQFLGMSPEVEKDVRQIIEDNLTKYFENEFIIKN